MIELRFHSKETSVIAPIRVEDRVKTLPGYFTQDRELLYGILYEKKKKNDWSDFK